MTTTARTRTIPDTAVVKPRARRPLSARVGRWWRRGWYKTGRGAGMRRLVRLLGWQHPAAAGTFGSSRQMAALSPLLAASDPPVNGHPLGVDLLTNQAVRESVRGLYRAGFVNSPNECVIGAVGTAKSTYVKLSLLRSITVGGRGVVFDRKRQQTTPTGEGTSSGASGGEYAKLSAAVGGSRIGFHQDRRYGTRINILDPSISKVTGAGEDSMLGQDRLLIMVAEAALGAVLTPQQRWALLQAHTTATRQAAEQGRVPVLADVLHALQHPGDTDLAGVDAIRVREWGLDVVLALSRYTDGGDLSGLIDGPTAGPGGAPVSLDAPLLVFDTSALEYGSTALGVIMAVTVAFLMSAWINVPGAKSVVIEETYSADGIGVIPAMFRDLAKRSRGVGASMISVFHHLSDVPPNSPLRSLITESEVVCVFRQDKSEDADQVMRLLSFDDSIRELVMTLPRGVHIRKRGAKLPVLVVEATRTTLERDLTFTDDALL